MNDRTETGHLSAPPSGGRDQGQGEGADVRRRPRRGIPQVFADALQRQGAGATDQAAGETDRRWVRVLGKGVWGVGVAMFRIGLCMLAR